MKRPLALLLILASSLIRADPASDAYREARALLKEKRFAEAASRFGAAASTTNATFAAAAWLGQGEAFFGQQQWTSAIASYDRLLKDYPDNDLAPKALYSRGCAEERAGRLEAARATFSGFVSRFPSNALASACSAATVKLAQTLDALNKKSDIEALTRELAEINALVRGEKYALAREAAARFLAAHPQHAQATNLSFLVATCAYKANDYPRAIDAFRRFLACYPSHPRASAARGLLADGLMRSRHYAEAALLFETIRKETEDPIEKARATLSLGDCAAARECWTEAEEHYLSVEVLESSEALRPVALARLAELYEKSGQPDKARRARDDRRRRYPTE